MKLWLKIFLSILLLSLTTLFISTSFVINKSHISNIKREQERSINEFDLIKLSIQNNVDLNISSKNTIKIVAARYGEYYEEKGIHLLLYHKGEFVYKGSELIKQNDLKNFLSVESGTKTIQILEEGNRHYIVLSGLFLDNNQSTLIYIRDIQSIYDAKYQSIQMSVALAFLFVLILGIFSYLYAKWITRPIDSLHKGAIAISGGDYSVKIKRTSDEFGDVVNAFNDMAEAIENRTEQLEQKAKERQVFIDDLSHEMNTPLTSIQGYAEFLLSANASDEQKQKSAKNIYTEAKRMKDIYTKLMTITFAREQSIELIKIPLNTLIDEITDAVTLQLEEKDIKLVHQIHLPIILGDKTLIYMLLINLIKNSMQAIENGGIIEIKAYEENKNSILSISDNGIGIPKDKLEEVVKPFFRVDKSRSRKTGGAGLGLSICKDIVSLHHGELIIESELGKGTMVKIILPMK
ncbi:MAG: HAMP domain-containing sensor histidine kinase [Anaerocolumna aminovalerica]|uniref:sensor histidine kinase n=1 Tax=Anaerocolumna aminovalerica TaxID=1527 RepID=UPI001C0F282D|nr:HAMP domain-containing sensor histidine kinase [Anaerocolumna aminovalerica]MBU5332636.1 HAMP domain-containing histidine kinase [Anaerocolumna aminovalerica]MDU6265669.1 HAMP domain-containing sensor histidine kinase [Anaerocolumna aminovalerica]